MGKKSPVPLLTTLIIVGLSAAYVNTTGVASFMMTIITHYHLDPIRDQILLNLLDSIVFPLFVLFSFVGTIIGRRCGLRSLFSLILLLTGMGTCFSLFADKSIIVLFIGRIFFGMGMGMNIPFAGMRVMAWYQANQRARMNALDPLQTYIGSLISFVLIPSIALGIGGGQLDKGFLFAMASPGFVVLGCWLFLMLCTGKSDIDSIDMQREEDPNYIEPHAEKGMFYNLLKRKDIVLFMIMVVCDFGVFVTLCSILTRWLTVSGQFSEYAAAIWSGLALPLFGIFGIFLGTSIAIRSGKRKTVIVYCQFIKFFAIMMASLGGSHSVYFIIVGVMMYGVGNAAWMMPLAQTCMELPDMNHVRFGGALALIQAASCTAGIVIPVFQGMLSTFLIKSSGLTEQKTQLAYGFKWSMFILGLLSIVSIVSALCLRETGKGKTSSPL